MHLRIRIRIVHGFYKRTTAVRNRGRYIGVDQNILCRRGQRKAKCQHERDFGNFIAVAQFRLRSLNLGHVDDCLATAHIEITIDLRSAVADVST